ncbi:MAG TPA: hypothetical protein VN802_09170 [Stellaceae bacterium]|nr:hypothetical protein [Stellaceae bacterium]
MTPAERIAKITAALAEARAEASDGARVDLMGLAGAVEEAMHAAREAPLDERAALTAEMLGLLKELDGLVVALARQHHAEAQRRAAAAYGGSPPPREEDR